MTTWTDEDVLAHAHQYAIEINRVKFVPVDFVFAQMIVLRDELAPEYAALVAATRQLYQWTIDRSIDTYTPKTKDRLFEIWDNLPASVREENA